jgi:hypothetical protein
MSVREKKGDILLTMIQVLILLIEQKLLPQLFPELHSTVLLNSQSF